MTSLGSDWLKRWLGIFGFFLLLPKRQRSNGKCEEKGLISRPKEQPRLVKSTSSLTQSVVDADLAHSTSKKRPVLNAGIRLPKSAIVTIFLLSNF
jgi:hypothetical protein